MPSKVVIVEDNDIVRGCLEELVNSVPGCECVGTFSTAEDAIRIAPRLAPDLAMMDIHLPNLSGIECASRLKTVLPQLQILMLTVYEDEDKIFQAFKAGASGYILKRSSPHEITRAIQDMLGGGVPMTSAIARKVVDSFRPTGVRNPNDPELSRRETEVLQSLSKGLSNKEIADDLSITVETVRWHLKQIYEKLHVHGRTEAALKFMGMQGNR
ncbi:response regulator transcription factor [Luteolibacter sp. LG18]|uniref:response regulator transcription factor n=1 Tax=Luteolibacter sp. LG18 TaxID=2819286 RepID=UPI002B2BD3AC|nr:DNA-binding response regulator [Luteolibacter sp. LG18]